MVHLDLKEYPELDEYVLSLISNDCEFNTEIALTRQDLITLLTLIMEKLGTMIDNDNFVEDTEE